MADFFIVCPLGLEEELARELREIEPLLLGPGGRPSVQGYSAFEVQKGGVLVSGEPLVILQIHFFSKIASRILMRIKSFQTTEFSKLEKELKKIEIKKWIGESSFSLKVASSRSKLGQEKRIHETATRAFRGLVALGSEAPQRLFLRAEHDVFELSLDLSGEHLHRRGVGRELGGLAPLRETLAAALVRFLIHDESASKLSEVTLLDPMAGSGTLLAEASDLYRPLFHREFAFKTQPWVPKVLLSPAYAHNYRGLSESLWRGFVARDAAKAARERLRELEPVLSAKQAPALKVLTPEEPLNSAAPVWVIANPPYGERLEKIPTIDLVQILLNPLPERVAVILPEALAQDLARNWPNDWEISKQKVLNGGLPCLLLRFVKNF